MQTPLLLDPLPEHPAETYYLYREATIVDAKKLVVEVFAFLPNARAHKAEAKRLQELRLRQRVDEIGATLRLGSIPASERMSALRRRVGLLG